MKAQIILAAKSFKHNNPHTSLNLETCRFKRLKELLNEPDVFIRRVDSSTIPLKVFYYA